MDTENLFEIGKNQLTNGYKKLTQEWVTKDVQKKKKNYTAYEWWMNGTTCVKKERMQRAKKKKVTITKGEGMRFNECKTRFPS